MTIKSPSINEIDLLDLLSKILIPTIIGYVTFVIANRQLKLNGVTQFRQKWIDNLRDSLSLFIAKAEMISMLDLKDNKTYFEHFKELSQMQNKIELSLNPNEIDHNLVLKLLEDIRELVHNEDIDGETLDRSLDKKIKELIAISKKVLKREWEVVKKGK